MQNDNFNPNQPPEYNPINQAEQPILPTDPQPIIGAPFTPPTPPPKKSKKGLIILIVLIGAILLIGGAILAYLLLQPKNTANSNTPEQTQNDTTPADATDYAKVLIDKVQTAEAALVSKHPATKVTSVDASAPVYKTDSDEFYVTGKIGYTISVIADEATINDPKNTFKTDIITAANSGLASDTTLTKSDTPSRFIYQSTHVICSFPKQAYPLQISCANKRDYPALYETLKPLTDAFVFSQGKANLATAVFGTPTITKKNNGYANATVNVSTYEAAGGYAALFYGNDDQWIFWQGAQSTLSCNSYNTYALQESFLDAKCYDTQTNTEATVKLLQ